MSRYDKWLAEYKDIATAVQSVGEDKMYMGLERLVGPERAKFFYDVQRVLLDLGEDMSAPNTRSSGPEYDEHSVSRGYNHGSRKDANGN